MIIPIRCITCNKVLANKWEAFKKAVDELETEGKQSQYYDEKEETSVANFERLNKGKILDKLGLDRICCRRHMLGHVELIDII